MAISSGAGPHFAFLQVDGGSFPVEHGSVSQQGNKKSSTFTAVVPLNYPGAAAALASLGSNTATISVSSLGGALQVIFTGEVDTTDFDMIGGTIHVSGRDKGAQLHENKTSEKWLNKMGSDIVSDLAGRLGISVNADASSLMAGKMLQQDYVRLSDNVSFGYVIHKLAELDGARWWIDQNGTMQYRALGNPAGIYTVNYAPAVEGFASSDATVLKISRNVQAGKNISVSVSSWHPKKKQVFNYSSNVEGSGGTSAHNYNVPNLLQDHVTKYAKSRAKELARHEYTVHATVVGDPSINVAMGLQLNGTGYFDQLYEMDTVHHEFGMSGYTTSITARSPKSGRTPS
jgi:hypothetical protein